MALKPEPAASSLSQSFINFTSSVLGQDVHVDSLDDRHIHNYINWNDKRKAFMPSDLLEEFAKHFLAPPAVNTGGHGAPLWKPNWSLRPF